MRQARPARIGGTVKLQFAVAAGIFCLLAAILLVRLMPFEADAERAEVELTIRNIRVGIQMAVGERIMQSEEYRIAEVLAANPMDFLASSASRGGDSAGGRLNDAWSYDRESRELRYQPRLPEAFANAKTLRWRFVARVDYTGRTVGAGLEAVN